MIYLIIHVVVWGLSGSWYFRFRFGFSTVFSFWWSNQLFGFEFKFVIISVVFQLHSCMSVKLLGWQSSVPPTTSIVQLGTNFKYKPLNWRSHKIWANKGSEGCMKGPPCPTSCQIVHSAWSFNVRFLIPCIPMKIPCQVTTLATKFINMGPHDRVEPKFSNSWYVQTPGTQ